MFCFVHLHLENLLQQNHALEERYHLCQAMVPLQRNLFVLLRPVQWSSSLQVFSPFSSAPPDSSRFLPLCCGAVQRPSCSKMAKRGTRNGTTSWITYQLTNWKQIKRADYFTTTLVHFHWYRCDCFTKILLSRLLESDRNDERVFRQRIWKVDDKCIECSRN